MKTRLKEHPETVYDEVWQFLPGVPQPLWVFNTFRTLSDRLQSNSPDPNNVVNVYTTDWIVRVGSGVVVITNSEFERTMEPIPE